MAYIRSANASNFSRLEKPGASTQYVHPAETRRGSIPMAFQVTSPFDNRAALLPHALVLHINPASFSEQHTKKVERIQTRGGWVEQHWGDELSDITCEGSTGAFVNLYTGMSSLVRQKTIAWDRYRDLYDLYRNNGSVYDPFGNIVLQGHIQLLYDRGAYLGTFRSFEVEETADAPFIFKLSWTFKVEQTLVRVPGAIQYTPSAGLRRGFVQPPGQPPSFQSQTGQPEGTVISTPPVTIDPTNQPGATVSGEGTNAVGAIDPTSGNLRLTNSALPSANSIDIKKIRGFGGI
jgi:hypothetical protein